MTDKSIWILGDLRTVRHWQESLKVLTKALPLAEEAHEVVVMVLLGSSDQSADLAHRADESPCVALDTAVQEAVIHGANTVYCVEHPDLAVPRTDTYAHVLTGLVKAYDPWLVLVPESDFSREISAFCTQRCQAGLIADCDELVFKSGQIVGRCPAWGGQIIADITLADGWPTAFVTVRPHGVSLKADPSLHGRIEKIVPQQVKFHQGMALLSRTLESPEGRRLEEAGIVVVGGIGLGDIHGFGMVRELAAALGGEVGATRPPVLYHWIDEQRLIGQTGKSIRPKLLITVGTSGAIQYTAGIMESELIVAVNRDPTAPIFQLADVGIEADAALFLPPLIQQVKEMAMRRLTDAACNLGETDSTTTGGFGPLVRQLREARNWLIEDLAQKTGQTPDFVSQVEADQMSPPVGFIMRMAQAMEVDPGTFLSQEEQATIRDRRAQAYFQRTQNYSYTTLTPDAENSHLRVFMVTIDPYLAHKPVAYKHEGEEFIFVMNGELEFTLGTKVHVLKPGESIHFNSDVPHKLKNLSSETTQCLVVVYTI